MQFFSQPYTKENIERQYKVLAKVFHPDTKTGNEELFKKLCEQKESLLKLTNRKPVKMMRPPIRKTSAQTTKTKNKITSHQVKELIESANQLLSMVKKLRKL